MACRLSSSFTGAVLKAPGLKKLLWIAQPRYPVLVSLPVGQGEVIICTLQLKGRLARSGGRYDPMAGRLLLNLLCRRPGHS